MFSAETLDLFVTWTPLAIVFLAVVLLSLGAVALLLFAFRIPLTAWFAARWSENSSKHARTVAVTATGLYIGTRLGIAGVDPVSLNAVLSLWGVALYMFVRSDAAPIPAVPAPVVPVLLIGLLTFGLSSCAQYIQDAETIAQMGVGNQQRIDDDLAKGVSIAPQAIPAGALARFPSGPQKCALGTLAGLELNGCTAATAQDVANIVQQQMSVHFGPAASITTPAAAAPVAASPQSSAAPAVSNKTSAQAQAATSAMAALVTAKSQQH